MKAKDPESYARRGQSSSSRSTKKRSKNSTRRRLARRMSSAVRQEHQIRKMSSNQVDHRMGGAPMPVNPFNDAERKVDFFQWFTSILPKSKDEPTTAFGRMHRRVMGMFDMQAAGHQLSRMEKPRDVDEEEGVAFNPETGRHEYKDSK